MAIKANELMIGDWVYDSILKDNTKVVKLDLNEIKGEFHVKFHEEDSFEPISLTNYILGKNHFRLTKPDFMTLSEDEVWHLGDEYYDWSIDLENQSDDNGNEYFVIRVNSGANNIEIYIRYVHQLQHALKLCGIEKEIEL